MKVIILHGSPHPLGNSSTLAEYFLRGLGEENAEHFYANDMRIRPCQGCEKNAPHRWKHTAPSKMICKKSMRLSLLQRLLFSPGRCTGDT